MDWGKEKYINSVNLKIHTDFPYLVLDVVNDQSYPRNPGFQVMHWHEVLQFIYLLQGKIAVHMLEHAIQVQQGEGIFINKDVVHDVRRLGNCHYNSFIFPAYFLEFYTGSPAKSLIDGVIANAQFPFYRFTPEIDWHREVLAILQQLVELERSKTEFYAYEVLVRLSMLWLAMRKRIILPPEKEINPVNTRMHKILRYIEQHYAEDVALEDLSKSANISKSECSRCFKLSLNTTPYQYLMEFRLSKAAQLLKTTDETIGNLAAKVGFHQQSHFGKCFREKTGYSPREYRKKMKEK